MAFGAILPWWSAVMVFALVFVLAVMGLMAADAVVEEIHVQDVKLKKDVSLMRGLQSKVHMMAAQCENPDAAAAVKQFAEDIRYSDPVSSDAIAEIEADLSAAVDELQAAIVDGDSNVTKQLCRKAAVLLAERNRLCKLNKHTEAPAVEVVEIHQKPADQRTLKFTAFAAMVLASVFAVVVLTNVVIAPNVRYYRAVKLMEKGNAVEAYEALMAMDGYKDTAEKAASIYDRYNLEKLRNAGIGDTVVLGSYEQDGNTDNGTEDMLWLILDQQDNRLLLISKYALDLQPYHGSREDITWEKSTLRDWLNNGFVNSAFTETEKNRIHTTEVVAERNPVYHTKAGENTQDQIFLLSADEATRYFSSMNDRMCQLADGQRCCWWLRNAGCYQMYAAVIEGDGALNDIGAEVNSIEIGIRPAIWINLYP